MSSNPQELPELDFFGAYHRLKNVVTHTPLLYNAGLSEKYQCEIYLKREDLQVVRSYKIRGAYNLISSLDEATLSKGVVTASAGNHAQGVAFSCRKLEVKGVIFMPEITPRQKVEQTKMFGKEFIEIVLVGDTFDDCLAEALQYTSENAMTFVPPFDHKKVIEGQGTVGIEILQQLPDADVVVMPVGGGGLSAGVGTYLRQVKPNIKLHAVEPEGAPSLREALKQGAPVTLSSINKFVDGAAVKRIGDLTFMYHKKLFSEVLLIPEGKVCTTILKLYNKDAIVVEPAGALTVAALDYMREQIKGKKVVCIISGGNNDIDRMQEIKEKSLLFEGLKHYFILRFPQRPGALKLFVNEILGTDADITRFEYIKKTDRDSGPALIGIELKKAENYQDIISKLKDKKFDFVELNQNPILFEYLV